MHTDREVLTLLVNVLNAAEENKHCPTQMPSFHEALHFAQRHLNMPVLPSTRQRGPAGGAIST